MKYLIIFLLLPLTAIAQSLLSGGCGNDIINPENNLQIALLKDLKKNNVFIKSINTSNNIEAEKYLSNNNEIKQYSSLDFNSEKFDFYNDILDLNQNYVIPVVVHLLHDGGNIGTGLNIKEQSVVESIENLNTYWNNSESSPIHGEGVSMNIKFKLAEIDENGQPTSGINRVDMSSNQAYLDHGINYSAESVDGIDDYNSDAEINSMREFASWNPEKYYNIYVVNSISDSSCNRGGIQGYARYSGAHGSISDGTVIINCAFVDVLGNSTLAHELGHAFSLPHTFNGDLRVEDGIQVYGCGDDGIDDTAKHKRSTANATQVPCNSTEINFCDPTFDKIMSPTKTGTGTDQDIVRNTMNYGSCTTEFTFGQQRLTNHAMLLNRTSYINSDATGINFQRPDVSFIENESKTGGILSWSNYNNPISNTIYLFSGGDTYNSFINGANTTNETSVNLDYIDQGMRHTLMVNANYENDLKKTSEITVTTKIVREYFDDFEDNSKVGDWIVLNGGDSGSWRLQTNLSSGDTIEGAWHILYDATTTHDDYLISPIIEVKNGLTDGISFNAKNESMTYMEDIDLYVIDENYENILGTLQENLTPPEEYLNYKFDLSEYEGRNIRIGFHSTTLDQYIFYMDDFKVGNYNTLSLNKIINDEIIIYPNPVNSILKIDGTFKTAKIYDLKGKLMIESSESIIDVTQFPQSIYIVKVITGEESADMTLKLIKE